MADCIIRLPTAASEPVKNPRTWRASSRNTVHIQAAREARRAREVQELWRRRRALNGEFLRWLEKDLALCNRLIELGATKDPEEERSVQGKAAAVSKTLHERNEI
jgi:hypothetical protein